MLQDGETKRLADSVVSGREVFVLETATSVEETGYKSVISYVDRKTCTLLKSELLAAGGGLRKVLEADLSTLIDVNQYWLILGYTMRDSRAGTQTALKLSDV